MIFRQFWTRWFFVLGFMVSTAAGAATQFRGVMKEVSPMMDGPGEKFKTLAPTLSEGEVVLVLGNSTAGVWLNVMKVDGTEGWVPLSRVNLYKVPLFELDEMEEVFQRKRRVISSWIVDLGPSFESSPNALGGGLLVWWVPFSQGLMARKIDQLEIGTGFLYSSRIESSSGSSGAFAEMPMLVQWMFRMPPRGSLMAGPRVGGTLIQDSVDTSKGNFAFTWGASLRFFPYDELGFFLDLAVVHRTSLFLTRQAGISFRF